MTNEYLINKQFTELFSNSFGHISLTQPDYYTGYIVFFLIKGDCDEEKDDSDEENASVLHSLKSSDFECWKIMKEWFLKEKAWISTTK